MIGPGVFKHHSGSMIKHKEARAGKQSCYEVLEIIQMRDMA